MRNRHLQVVRSRQAQSRVHEQTVGEWLEEWLWAKQSLRPSTHASYEGHVRLYLVPHLGGVKLADLRAGDVEQMFRELTRSPDHRTRSAATLRRIHATLMSALNTAVRRGLIERNPAGTVELPRAAKPRLDVWSAEELSSFLHAIEEDRLHLLYVLLGLVGLRRGEVVGLRWQDVDLNAGLLRIEQSLVRVGDQLVTGPPKSRAGVRTVAIDVETARRLHWHQCRQRLEARQRGSSVDRELVFTTSAGNPLDPAYVSRLFDRLIVQAGARRMKLHCLRHTSASIGLASGESLLEVSRRLGHSSITVTADIYSSVSTEMAKESAERLAQLVRHP